MNDRRLRPHQASARPSPASRERGVVMFIALLVMVALSLAGIALIRSADTATVVSGNLAFKQAAIYAVDRSVEQADRRAVRPARAGRPAIVDKTADLPAQNYFACVQATGGGCLPANAPIPEIPTVLTTKALAETLDAVGSRGRRQQQELLRDRAHVRQRGSAARQQLQSVQVGTWAPTRERNITRVSSVPAMPITASRFASKVHAIRWPMRRRSFNSARHPRFARSSTMTSPRPSAFRRYCAAVVAAALVLQPLGAYAATIASSPLAENPLQGIESRQAEHHVHDRRLREYE